MSDKTAKRTIPFLFIKGKAIQRLRPPTRDWSSARGREERRHDFGTGLAWPRGSAWAVSSGAVEGLNNKLKIIIRRSYGFRIYDVTTTAPYHALGKLPEPPLIHRFH